jgi:RNA polymerase sigma-70 factor (ECF subfamily)
MSFDDSNGNGDQELQQLYSESLRMIPDAVRKAFHRYKYKPNKLELDGLAQQVRVRLLDNDYAALRSFKHQASLKTWLQKITNNLVSRYVQRQRRKVSLERFSPDAFFSKATPEARVISKEQKEMQKKKLKAALSKLTPRQRQLYDLSCQDDLDDEEIAKRMGIKPNSVSSLRRKLIAKLRRLLEEGEADLSGRGK